MTDLTALRSANARRWANARLTRNLTPAAKALAAAKARYRTVEASTGVPWFVIAAIHERECSQDWSGPGAGRSMGQGFGSCSGRTRAVQIVGRCGDRCADHCAPYAARNEDWTIGGPLTTLEQYNGLGYAARGVPCPYVWAGTDQYRSGKYFATASTSERRRQPARVRGSC